MIMTNKKNQFWNPFKDKQKKQNLISEFGQTEFVFNRDKPNQHNE